MQLMQMHPISMQIVMLQLNQVIKRKHFHLNVVRNFEPINVEREMKYRRMIRMKRVYYNCNCL